MSMPLFPIARTLTRRLGALGLALLATATLAAPVRAQVEPPVVPRPLARPAPPPDPILPPSPTTGSLDFGPSSTRIAILTAGDTFSENISVGCSLGRTTVDLSVAVDPPAFGATVEPTRVTTPGRFTVTAPTNLTTPANEYRITITATRVSGPCASSSTTRLVLVEKPIRLAVQPTSQTTAAGAATSYNVTILRKNGANGRVTLRATDLPGDVQASFAPPATNGNASTLTLSVPPGSTSCPPPNGCDFRIRGSANGNVEVQAVPARLIVRKQVVLRVDNAAQTIQTGSTATFNVQVMRSGYAGSVRLQQQDLELPDNRRFSTLFDPNGFSTAATVRFEVSVFVGGQGRYRFRLSPELPGAPADVTLVPVEVTVDAQPPRGVNVTLTPPSRTVARGASTTYDLQIVKNGVPSVRFGSARGLPSNVATVTPDGAVDPTRITVAVESNAPSDTYPFDVLVQYDEDGSIVSQASNEVELVVGGGGNVGTVSLEIDPTQKVIDAGSSRTFVVTARPQGGFAGLVQLTYLPDPNSPAVNASFSDDTVDVSTGLANTSILTLGAPAGTPTAGPFQGRVTGTATPAATVGPAAVNYRILAANQASLTVQLAPGTFSLRSGDPLTLTATITRFGNCSSSLLVNGFASPFNAFGAVSFQPVAGLTDTFRANLVAGPVTVDTPTTISVSALAQGCVGGSAQISGSVRPKLIIPPLVTPTITSFTPPNGSAGTSVQIFGTGFENVQNVLFTGPNGGVGAAFALISPTQVNATVPGFAATGPIRVVTAAGTATSAASFTVGSSNQAPQITGFSPASGGAGTSVRITGVKFTGTFDVSFGTPTFGFLPIGFTTLGGTQIDGLIPAGTPSGFFRVSTAAGTATSAMAFQVTTPNLPEIGGFNPLSGPSGTRVEIVGSNLGTATQVTFNGTPASFEPPQPNRIFATVPPGATTGPIRVTTPAGTATSFTPFAVSSGGPVITGFQPPSGRAGDSVTIAGVNFTGVTQVTINGFLAPIGIVTSNFVQVFVPAGATTGPIRLTTPAGTATSQTSFTVLP